MRPARLVLKDRLVLQDLLVLQARKDHKAHRALQALLVSRDLRVPLELPDLQGPQGHRARKDLRA